MNDKLPIGAEPGTCDGPNCRRPILWVRTVHDASMPLDPEPVRVLIKARGNLSSPRYTTVTAYTPHWATCPDRIRFKRERTAADDSTTAHSILHTTPSPAAVPQRGDADAENKSGSASVSPTG